MSHNHDLLQQAKQNYKEGESYYSATKKLKTILTVYGEIRMSSHYKNTIVCDTGIIYTDGDWAEKIITKKETV